MSTSWRTADPCDRCGSRHGRCSVSDGAAICRTPTAWQSTDKVKADRDGSEYAVLDGANHTTVDAPTETWRPPLASPDDLDRVHRAMLKTQHLDDGHRLVVDALRNVLARGVTHQEAQDLRWFSYERDTGKASDLARAMVNQFGADTAYHVPGIYIEDRTSCPVLATFDGDAIGLPVLDLEGRWIATQVRLLAPRAGEGKTRWVSTPSHPAIFGVGQSAVCHVPMHTDEVFATGIVFVTEGVMKADIATLRTKCLYLGIPGVTQRRDARNVLAVIRQRHGVTRVAIAFDADARKNPNVAGALQRFAAELRGDGFDVGVQVWDETLGKGVDDVVVNPQGGPSALETRWDVEAVRRIADLVWSSGAKPDPDAVSQGVLDDLLARLAKDTGAPFAGDFASKAAGLSVGHTAQLRNALTKARVPLREWNALLKGHHQEKRKADKREARKAAAAKATAPDAREVHVDTDEHRVTDEAAEALGACLDIYQRGGELVHLTRERIPGDPVDRPFGASYLVPVSRDRLQGFLSKHVLFTTMMKDEETGEQYKVVVHPPQFAVRQVAALGQWPAVRPLVSMVEYPVLRPDGTVLDVPGYDHATGLLYAPFVTDELSVPDAPTQDDAREAAKRLVDAFVDWPFKADCHRATAVCAVLTPFARFAFNGPAPMFLVDANREGAGKSLLVGAIGYIVLGRFISGLGFPADDNAELSKRITSFMREGDTVVSFDNIKGLISGEALERLITCPTWKERRLGVSENTKDIPNRVTVLGTSNNATVGPDMARRILPIRLETELEDPGAREDFAHGEGWLQTHRAGLAADSLTILRAYQVAGRPKVEGLRPFGDFPQWSATVRAAAVWAGLADPMEGREEFKRNADVRGSAHRLLIEGLRELDPAGGGMTSLEILNHLGRDDARVKEAQAARETAIRDGVRLTGNPPEQRFAALRSALGELCPRSATPQSIGKAFQHLCGKNVGGWILDRHDTKHGALWRVRSAACGASGGDSGDSGDSSTNPAHASTPNIPPANIYPPHNGMVGQTVTTVTTVTAPPHLILHHGKVRMPA